MNETLESKILTVQIYTYILGLKRWEVTDNVVHLYFDEIGPRDVCATFRMLREVEVTDAKPARVNVYDYYEPELKVEKVRRSKNKLK